MNLEEDIYKILEIYPDLEVIHKDKVPIRLQGPITIQDISGNDRGLFEIQIIIPANYPFNFPILREISNKIPKIPDRHINSDGTCCLTVIQKQSIEAKRGIYLTQFITRYVVPYLANQLYFEKYKKWAGDEYKHGIFGFMQFYEETFKTNEFRIILKGIQLAYTELYIDGDELCFCGKDKYKLCHRKAVNDIRQMEKKQLLHDAGILRGLIKAHQLIIP